MYRLNPFASISEIELILCKRLLPSAATVFTLDIKNSILKKAFH